MVEEKKRHFFSWIWRRLHMQNKNFIALFVGPTGSGKSYAALRLAELLDPKFTAERIVFGPEELLELLRSKKLKRGDVIVYDEAGATIGARDFASMKNKIMHTLSQTFRYMNLAIIYTVPAAKFVDVGLREMAHCILQTQSIDHKNKLCRLRPSLIEVNSKEGKIYYKFPRYRQTKGSRKIVVLRQVMVNLPKDTLIEAYEAKKLDFNKKLQDKMAEQMKPKEKSTREPFNIEAMAEELHKDPQDCFTKRGALDDLKIEKRFGIGDWSRQRLRRAYNEKFGGVK